MHVQLPNRRRAWLWAGLTLLLLPAAPASSSASSGQTTTNVGPITSLILTANSRSWDDQTEAAENVLVAQCMRLNGFAFQTGTPQTGVPEPPSSSIQAREYEFTSVPTESAALAAAKSWGFGVPALRELIHRRSSQQHAASSGEGTAGPGTGEPPPSSAYDEALEGPDGQNGRYTVPGLASHSYTTVGCLAEARTTLYGSAKLAIESEYLPQDLDLAEHR